MLRALAAPAVAGLVAVTLKGCGGGSSVTTSTTSITTSTLPPVPTTTTQQFPAGPCDCTKCSVSLDRGQCNKCTSDGHSGITCGGCKPGYTFSGGKCKFTCGTPEKRPDMPASATEMNGAAWPTMCVQEAEAHFFTIGDWGGVCSWTDNVCKQGQKPYPMTDPNHRPAVKPYDNMAQDLVAMQMEHRAMAAGNKPFAILNVGDNFYPGGINDHCGKQTLPTSKQFDQIYEEMYKTSHIKDVEWWGVLGNHDYGGVCFVNGWDQQIMYTWGDAGRWTMPAQYWSRTVQFEDFTADFWFLDTNAEDTYPGGGEPNHNLCGLRGNTDKAWYCGAQAVGPKPLIVDPRATCDTTGPKDLDDCMNWFTDLNDKQFGSAAIPVGWLEKGLQNSKAEWQIVVTHFPPRFTKNSGYWQRMSRKYGIDLIVAGHTHFQAVYYMGSSKEQGNYNLQETAWVVTGGGGGITSERTPVQGGHDDAYGFMDMKINKDVIHIEAVSHGGIIRNRTDVLPRPKAPWGASPGTEAVV